MESGGRRRRDPDQSGAPRHQRVRRRPRTRGHPHSRDRGSDATAAAMASRGDALRIGEALGARTAYLDAYQGHAALAMPAATLAGWATVMHGAVLVDRHGRRFGDETTGYSEYASEVIKHADGAAWIVLDQRIDGLCRPFQDYLDTRDSGAVRWADDIAGLAAAVGIDEDGLADTLADCALIAQGDQEDKFGRRSWEAPLEPPYAAIAVRPALFHTQGGLVVDAEARVLHESGLTHPRPLRRRRRRCRHLGSRRRGLQRRRPLRRQPARRLRRGHRPRPGDHPARRDDARARHRSGPRHLGRGVGGLRRTARHHRICVVGLLVTLHSK